MITLIALIMLISLIALPGRQDAQGYQDYQGYQPLWSATLARPRRAPVPTVAACVRRFCLDCLGATSGRAAFDCGSEICPLRPASPFLGKPMPLTMRDPAYRGEPGLVLKRRPSRRLIHAQCRQCQPGDTTDCLAEDCGLYPFRPWDGPGKAAKRKLSEKRLAQIAAARNRSPLMQPFGRREQKPSTAVGAALDA
jgi:hypothetical protein